MNGDFFTYPQHKMLHKYLPNHKVIKLVFVKQIGVFHEKFAVVEQPKCGTKNIGRIFRRGQTSSGLPPVNSCFGSI